MSFMQFLVVRNPIWGHIPSKSTDFHYSVEQARTEVKQQASSNGSTRIED